MVRRQNEIYGVEVRVEDQVEAVVLDRFTTRVGIREIFPVDKNSQALHHPFPPQLLACLRPLRIEPRDVFLARAVEAFPLEPATPVENGVSTAKMNRGAG